LISLITSRKREKFKLLSSALGLQLLTIMLCRRKFYARSLFTAILAIMASFLLRTVTLQ